jgi:hypothetical protein
MQKLLNCLFRLSPMSGRIFRSRGRTITWEPWSGITMIRPSGFRNVVAAFASHHRKSTCSGGGGESRLQMALLLSARDPEYLKSRALGELATTWLLLPCE